MNLFSISIVTGKGRFQPRGMSWLALALLSLFPVFSRAQTCVAPASGLVSWYPGETNANDIAGTNNGTVAGGVTFTAGEVGQAFDFDGSTGYVAIPASASLNVGTNSGLTIECWVNPESVTAEQPLVEWNDGAGDYGAHFWISVPSPGNGPGSLFANLLDTGGNNHVITSGAGLLVTNTFQHVAVTYNQASGVATLYINGATAASINLGSFTPQTSYNLYLATRPNSGAFFGGLLDEVSLYDRALAASEIQEIYSAGSAGKCKMPAAIATQPQSESLFVGNIATFNVTAVGSTPLSYQWQYNDSPLPGATNSSLVITNLQLTNGGIYSVIVSNPVNSVNSSNALLTVNQICAPPPSGLVSWYPGQSNANDIAGINNGAMQGGVTFTAGEVGGAFDFNGSTGYVIVPPSPSLNVGTNGGLTIECWVNPTSVAAGQPMVEWNNGSTTLGVHFWFSQPAPYGTGPGCLYANLIDTSGISHTITSGPGLVTSSNFQHVAVTYDKPSGVVTLYDNGAAVATTNIGNSFTPQTSVNLFLGGRLGTPGLQSGFLGGDLDEVSIYKRALAASEIQAIYNSGSLGKCALPPAIFTQPQGLVTDVGQGATFTVTASGSPPLGYQWEFNGNPLTGATNSSLVLTNVQLTNAGNYSVIVSNPVNSVTSSNAALTVNPFICTPPPSGLVSWYPGQSNANDIAGINNGAMQGGVTFTAGEVGGAFDFNGSTGYVIVPPSPSLNVGTNGGLTIECWVNPTSVAAGQPMVEWNNGSTTLGVHFWFSQPAPYGTGPGCLYANLIDTSGISHTITSGPGLVTSSNFQHVAVTYDKPSGVVTLYDNGAAVATTNIGNSFTPQTSVNLFLGGRLGTPGLQSGFLGGDLDEVSIYKRALAASEIQAIYNSGSLGKCALPPAIFTQPQGLVTDVGQGATFTVTASGSPPLGYQWEFNGNPLTGATNSSLVLTNVQLTNAGNYSVIVSNPVNSATSSNAVLTVDQICTPAPSGLVSWYPGQSNANDIAGINNGTINGGVTFAAGEVGTAFDLDGSTGYVSIPASPSLNVGTNGGITIECWIKPSSVAAQQPMVEFNNGSTFGLHFWISVGSAGCLYADVHDTSGNGHPISSAAGVIASNVFQHVALTYNQASGVATLYCNGAVVATSVLGSFTVQTTYGLYLGKRLATSYYYGGLLDEVSLYNRALAASEIQAIYDAGSLGKCALPPAIFTQPQGLVTEVGQGATFTVTASGTPPLGYQWRFNGSPLTGATNSSLVLTNVQLTNGGNYSVIVSNPVNSVTSSNAALTVNPDACAPPPAGLVSWYPGQSNANDIAGTNNGILEGGVTFAAGEVGQAFDFNGTNQYVQVPNSASLTPTGSFSIEAWIYPLSINASDSEIFSKWNGQLSYNFFLAPGQQIGFFLADAGDQGNYAFQEFFTPTNAFSLGAWTHVAAVYNQSTGTRYLYVNGVAVTNETQTPFTVYNGTSAIGIGAIPGSGAPVNPFNGLIDEVSFYNVALTAAQVQGIYNAGSLGKCALPPTIFVQPQAFVTDVGQGATFTVTASGSPPLGYQWKFNGSPLTGATNSSLVLTNVQFTNAGNYSVIVSNPVNSVTSSNAVLTVNPDVCAPPPAGLVSWYPGQSNANDIAGINNGTINGGVTFAAGEVGTAFDLDGSTGYVSIPASASLNVGTNGGITIECWIKPGSLAAPQPLVEFNNGSTFGLHFWISEGSTGDLYADIHDTGGTGHPISSAAGVITTNVFQHVAVTYNQASGVATLYCNGAVVATQNLGSFTLQTSYNLYFGKRVAGVIPSGYQLFGGALDEVSLYNRALAASEIQAIYNAGSLGKCALPPTIFVQPQGLALDAGNPASFSVVASGSPPLNYQWKFNGSNISSATTPLLTFNSVQLSNTGTYTVSISNFSGSVTSSNAILTVSSMPSCVSAPSNLISWWQGEGDAGDALGINNGTLEGGVTFAQGKVGQAFSFNGTNQYVDVPNSTSLNPAGSFTVEAWIYPLAYDAGESVAGKWGDTGDYSNQRSYFLSLQPNNVIWFSISDAANQGNESFQILASPSNSIPTNIWTHVAVVYNQTTGTRYIYVNGTNVASRTDAPITIFNGIADFAIGARLASSTDPIGFFAGQIDEVSLYNRALSASEIQAIYNADDAGKCALPVTFLTQPQNQQVPVHTNAAFAVTVSGTHPLAYQWKFNSNNVPGATNASLSLTNVQSTNSGVYSITASNSLGAATSSNAQLSVNFVLIYGNGVLLTNPQYTFGDSATIQLLNPYTNGDIFYTLNGTTPTISSTPYTGAFALTQSAIVTALGYSTDFTQSGVSSPVNITIVPAYYLATTSSGGGTISVNPTNQPYESGTVVSITATPLAGWTFLQWLGDASGTNATNSVLMSRNKSVQGIFGTTLSTTTAGGGSVQLEPAGGVYPYGTTVMLSAIPQAGNYFGLWGNAASGNANPLSFVVTNANPVVSSLFLALGSNQVSLAVAPVGLGKVTINPASNSYTSGTSVTVTAIPNAGQSFLGWTGGVTSAQNPLLLTLTQNTTLYANFTRAPTLTPFGLAGLADGFRLTLTGDFDVAYRIDVSTNLVNWTPLITLTNTLGTLQFIDTAATNFNDRYYRAVELP